MPKGHYLRYRTAVIAGKPVRQVRVPSYTRKRLCKLEHVRAYWKRAKYRKQVCTTPRRASRSAHSSKGLSYAHH